MFCNKMYKKTHYKTSNDLYKIKDTTQDYIYFDHIKHNVTPIFENAGFQTNNTTLLVENFSEEPTPDPPTIDMKWENIQYANTSDPEVWGPSFWFTLHNGSSRYPLKPSPICKERMRGFIMGMSMMIPCEICSDHANAHIESNWENMDKIVSSRDELFKFFWEFHNKVNKRYNKPEMSLEDAKKLYTGRANVSKLTYESNNKCK